VARSHRFTRPNILSLVAALCLVHPVAASAGKEPAEAPRVTLTADEQHLLDRLFKRGLFDPTGAKRVRGKTTVRTIAAGTREAVREAWFQKGTAGAPGKIVFLDGEEKTTSNRGGFETVDFIAACRSRFARTRPAPAEQVRDRIFANQQFAKPVEEIDKSPLAIAAWLHRLGHDDLAVRALAEARATASLPGKGAEDEWLVNAFRSDIAWMVYEEMIYAFMVSADDEAVAAGERLVRLFPDEAQQFRQPQHILADLGRRKKAGTFGRARWLQWPAEFKNWDADKQATFLIDSLDQIDGRHLGQPTFGILAEDPLMQALIRVGDPAVPALIKVIENDTRLTRAVRYWEDFARDRTVLSVREAALDAVMSITGTIFFESNQADDNFTRQGDAKARQMAQRLQVYWERYGKLPFDERMMKFLTDPASTSESKRQAASNLAHLGERRSVVFAQIRFESSRGGKHRAPAAAIAKFKNPTIASAILAALDLDLKHVDAQPGNESADTERRGIEDSYIQSLIELGDKRIAPELLRRSALAWQLRQRQLFASAANQLGAPGAMCGFAKQVEHAGFQLPANDPTNSRDEGQPGTVALRSIVTDLVGAKIPEADRALFAISAPQHPYFKIAQSRVCEPEIERFSEDRIWFSHPFCLNILRSELGNRDPTGGFYRYEGKRLIWLNLDGSVSDGWLPPAFSDPKLLKDVAFERRCDRAAMKLGLLVFGLPAYHPLAKDADARLKELARVFDHFQNGYHPMTPVEQEFLEIDSGEPLFLPNLPPLTRPATADDLKAGLAIFQLNGKGQLAPLKLPAVASLRRPHGTPSTSGGTKPLMIVQAEIDADGKTIYGVIGPGVVRRASEEELINIKPMKKSFFDFFK
jgi:hypothetical protein